MLVRKDKKDIWVFLLLLPLFIYAIYINRDNLSFFNARIFLMPFQQEFIAEEETNGFKFTIYKERGLSSNKIKMSKEIIRKAIVDFPPYIKRQYPELALTGSDDSNTIKIFIIGEKTWSVLNREYTARMGGDDCQGKFSPLFNELYLRAEKYNKETVRHEIFHRLIVYYGIESLTDNEEEYHAHTFASGIIIFKKKSSP